MMTSERFIHMAVTDGRSCCHYFRCHRTLLSISA